MNSSFPLSHGQYYAAEPLATTSNTHINDSNPDSCTLSNDSYNAAVDSLLSSVHQTHKARKVEQLVVLNRSSECREESVDKNSQSQTNQTADPIQTPSVPSFINADPPSHPNSVVRPCSQNLSPFKSVGHHQPQEPREHFSPILGYQTVPRHSPPLLGSNGIIAAPVYPLEYLFAPKSSAQSTPSSVHPTLHYSPNPNPVFVPTGPVPARHNTPLLRHPGPPQLRTEPVASCNVMPIDAQNFYPPTNAALVRRNVQTTIPMPASKGANSQASPMPSNKPIKSSLFMEPHIVTHKPKIPSGPPPLKRSPYPTIGNDTSARVVSNGATPVVTLTPQNVLNRASIPFGTSTRMVYVKQATNQQLVHGQPKVQDVCFSGHSPSVAMAAVRDQIDRKRKNETPSASTSTSTNNLPPSISGASSSNGTLGSAQKTLRRIVPVSSHRAIERAKKEKTAREFKESATKPVNPFYQQHTKQQQPKGNSSNNLGGEEIVCLSSDEEDEQRDHDVLLRVEEVNGFDQSALNGTSSSIGEMDTTMDDNESSLIKLSKRVVFNCSRPKLKSIIVVIRIFPGDGILC